MQGLVEWPQVIHISGDSHRSSILSILSFHHLTFWNFLVLVIPISVLGSLLSSINSVSSLEVVNELLFFN